MNMIETQEKWNKLTSSYEISRCLLMIESLEELCQQIVDRMNLAWCQSEDIFPYIEIYGKCFIPKKATGTFNQKFSFPILVRGEVSGQICICCRNLSSDKWFDDEDAKFLKNIANDLGKWLEQKQVSRSHVLLHKFRGIENAFDAHASIAITDREGKIEYVNDMFCTISKYSAEELVGQDHRIVNSGHHSKEFMRNLWGTISAGKTWKGIFKNRAKDGTFHWVDTTIVPVINFAGNPSQYVAIRTEVTEYKQLEEKMEGQVTELARSNDELEQFAYVVTHDLQEPLRAINSFTQLLQKYCNNQLDERANDLVSHIVAGTGRMQMLIDDLLTYAQVNASQALIEIDCEKLLNNVLIDLSVMIKECNAIITYDKLPIVKGIPFQFVQLFTNLINNSLKFKRELPPKIHISAKEQMNDWIFTVSDNGIGIEAQYLDRIFRVFQRLHSRKEYIGTGIGLAICKKVVEHHGGRIWVKSELHAGSSFHFSIPKID